MNILHNTFGLALGLHFLLPVFVTGQAPPFVQDDTPSGVVVIEAEHHTANVAVGSNAWVQLQLPTGDVVMKALPDVGMRHNTHFDTLSPRLEFSVLFARSGTHYMAVRGYGEEYTADTVHVGINGVPNTTSDRMQVPDNNMSWSNDTLDDIVASFDVPSAGEHTVTFWMREDGFMLDRFVISTHAEFLPEGKGPLESFRVGEGPPPPADPRRSLLTSQIAGDGMLTMPFMPVPGVAQYRLLMKPDLGAPFSVYPSAVTVGFTWMADVSHLDRGFFAVESVPVTVDQELCGLLLNRAGYGPTPDLLVQVQGDPAGYLAQQLAPETLVETADARPEIQDLESRLQGQSGDVDELRAWHSLRAVHADRQLLEVLLQFFDNHFSDSFDTVSNWLDDEGQLPGSIADRQAATMEFREVQQWRDILLDPDGTFYDLLKVSAESPAMILYLDTVENEAGSPNENYARELMELYTMGVDNGYTQDDIEEMARVWTGWRIATAHPDDDTVPPNPYLQPTMVPAESTGWMYRKGTSAPDPAWNQLNFVPDTNWLSGQAMIGYGNDGEITVLDDMRYNYSTVYFRHAFSITNASSIGPLTLRLLADDACVAYLNGTEVARIRAGAPGTPWPHDGEPDDFITNPDWETVVITDTASLLVDGDNVLAIHGLNAAARSADFNMDAEMIGGEPPVYKVSFDAAAHDVSNKVIFAGASIDPRFGLPWAGQSYELNLPERNGLAGMQDGYDVLSHLADLPYTMEYTCVKLCQVLVHEDFETGYYYNYSQRSPEADLIHACLLAWENPLPGHRKGNIRQVVQVILASDLFRSQTAARQKVKTPFEFVVSALRALKANAGGQETAASDGYDMHRPMSRAGMQLFTRNTPDGWPEEASEWIDTQTLSERLRFVQHYLVDPADSLKSDEYGSSGTDNVADPVALIMDRLPAGDLTDAAAVTDYFLSQFFPAVGAANLDLERSECLRLLNSDDAGVEDASPFSSLSPGAATYDARVRAMVALLLCSPKFQEQ